MTGSGPIFIPEGFKFSAVTAGIKISGEPDLALILADKPASAAALFTKNLIVAAPVEVGLASLKQSRGRVRAVVVNSGYANCATWRQGIAACTVICRNTSVMLQACASEMFPSSS